MVARSLQVFPYKALCVRAKGDGLPNGWSSIRNFHTCLARVRTMIGRRPDGWSWIHNFHICGMHVRTMLTDVRMVVFELRFLPYEWVRPENPRLPNGCINLPLSELGKRIWSWSIIGRRPDGLPRRPDGCKLEQKLLDADDCPDGNPGRPDWWCFCLSGIRTVWYVVQTDETVDGWASGRDDTSSERMSRNRFFLTVKQYRNSRTLLNSGIPVIKHLYIQVILSKQNVANHNLTNSSFGHSGTKITWPVWKCISGPKIKITPPFCHKETKGKTK
jgi:hypothetical protein